MSSPNTSVDTPAEPWANAALPAQKRAELLLAAMTFGGLFFLLQGWNGLSKTTTAVPSGFDAMTELGTALTSPTAYVLPFEVASVLLVAALVVAVYVAFNRK